jgi:hypothetical protein
MDGVDYKCQGPLNGTLKSNLLWLGLDVVIVDHPFNIYFEDVKTQITNACMHIHYNII